MPAAANIVIQPRLQIVMARQRMQFPAFLMQSHPAAASVHEIILDPHPQHRTDAGEGVNQPDERPIAQAQQRMPSGISSGHGK